MLSSFFPEIFSNLQDTTYCVILVPSLWWYVLWYAGNHKSVLLVLHEGLPLATVRTGCWTMGTILLIQLALLVLLYSYVLYLHIYIQHAELHSAHWCYINLFLFISIESHAVGCLRNLIYIKTFKEKTVINILCMASCWGQLSLSTVWSVAKRNINLITTLLVKSEIANRLCSQKSSTTIFLGWSGWCYLHALVRLVFWDGFLSSAAWKLGRIVFIIKISPSVQMYLWHSCSVWFNEI